MELQVHPYFKGIDFSDIFKIKSPINKEILLKTYAVGMEESKFLNI